MSRKKYFYILKLKGRNLVKIGVSDFIHARVDAHNNTYGVDLCESYIVTSNDNRVPTLLEKEVLIFFDSYKDETLYPSDGYTEVLRADCLERILAEVKSKQKRFPTKDIEIIKGISLPSSVVYKEKLWEELLFEMKVYAYYPIGIHSLWASVKNLRENTVPFDRDNDKAVLELSRIMLERINRGLIHPFTLEQEYYNLIFEDLNEVRRTRGLGSVGLSTLLHITYNVRRMLSSEDYRSPDVIRYKRPSSLELGLMRGTLSPSHRFLSWKNNLDKVKVDISSECLEKIKNNGHFRA